MMNASMLVIGVSSLQKRMSFAVGSIPDDVNTVIRALIKPISSDMYLKVAF